MRSFLTEGTAEVPGAHRANAAGFAPRPLSRSYRNRSSGYAFHDTELTFRLSSPTFTGMSQLAAADDRPLRADARRNREKVLAAARAVFSEAGRDAQIDDVARRAGVGVGTVYRHFPTKEALIEALMVEAFRSIADEAERALDVEDPWEALTRVLWCGAETMSADRALSEVFASIPGAMESAMPTIEGLTETMGVLIRRAQAAGVLRDDMIVDDIPMLMCGIGSATKKEHRCEGAWRRHLSIVLDGLRATSASSPLPK
jgi:AcrR family transcriptional regulator